eukprot:scaffold547_cov384-Prasinococcus_capsulatus_cf.AAC.30
MLVQRTFSTHPSASLSAYGYRCYSQRTLRSCRSSLSRSLDSGYCRYRVQGCRLDGTGRRGSGPALVFRSALEDPPSTGTRRTFEGAGERQELFNTISPVYDQLNDLLSLGQHRIWKRTAVKWAGTQAGTQWLDAGVGPGMRVLDLCCGSGDIALLLARTVGQDGSVVGEFALAEGRFAAPDDGSRILAGLDFAANILETAKVNERAISYIEDKAAVTWVEGDAMDLPFEDNEFDAATMGYGLRNVKDPSVALLEARRVLKPGGTLAVLDFNNNRDKPMVDAFQGFMLDNVVVPTAQSMGVEDEYRYLKPSIAAFLTGAKPVDRKVHHVLKCGPDLSVVYPGKEQERAALAVGFNTAVHYELAGGLMGCLVATT